MDAHAVARLSKLDEVLRQLRADYQNRERLRGDVASLLRACHTLQPRAGSFSNGGRTIELFYLYGVLPISYKGAEYNVPVTVYFDQPYPKQPPRCFVTPTPGMALKAGHQHVDEGGMIHLPYLAGWKESSSTLVELVALVTSAFSAAPPVYSTGAARSTSTAAPGSGSVPLGAVASRAASNGVDGRRAPSASRASSREPVSSREPAPFARARKDHLVQQVGQAVRERWATALAPVLNDLNDQLQAQRRLQSDDPSGLESTDTDGDEQQAFDCLAEELALDELLVSLDELLAAHKITIEDFLREVREVSRRQFLCRAQRLKSANIAAASAPGPEAADAVRHVPLGGQQALRATGRGAAGLADRSSAASRRL